MLRSCKHKVVEIIGSIKLQEIQQVVNTLPIIAQLLTFNDQVPQHHKSCDQITGEREREKERDRERKGMREREESILTVNMREREGEREGRRE